MALSEEVKKLLKDIPEEDRRDMLREFGVDVDKQADVASMFDAVDKRLRKLEGGPEKKSPILEDVANMILGKKKGK